MKNNSFRDQDLSAGIYRTDIDLDSIEFFKDNGIDGDAEFRILRRRVVNRPINRITFTGESYNALLVRDPLDVLENYFKIDIEDVVRDCFKVVDLSRFNSLAEQYRETVSWRAELVDAAGDGWLDFESAVSEELADSGEKELWDIYDSVNDEIDRRYFRGVDSTVQDLSVVDGVWTFDFASLSYAAETYLISVGLISKFWE